MNKRSSITTIILLLFNGIGAIYGGWNLMIHPNGGSIELSSDWLASTPFQNYPVPGIILFVCNGLFSFFVILAILSKSQYSPNLTITQGIILCCWLVITGLALIYLGWRSLNHSKK